MSRFYVRNPTTLLVDELTFYLFSDQPAIVKFNFFAFNILGSFTLSSLMFQYTFLITI